MADRYLGSHGAGRGLTPPRVTMKLRTVDARALRDRHLEYYLDLVEARDEAESASSLRPHYDNARSALRWALESGRITEAARLCMGLSSFWFGYQRFREALTFFRECLAKTPDDHVQRGHLLTGAAVASRELGRFHDSEQEYLEAWREFEAAGDAREAMAAELGRAWAVWYAGRYEDTKRFLEPILERLDTVADLQLRTRILELQGWTAVKLGDRRTAHQAFEAATATSESAGDPIALAEHLAVKGGALSQAGDAAGSEEARRRSVDLTFEHAPADPALPHEILKLAELRLARGDLDGAESQARRALALCEGRDFVAEAWSRLRLGKIALASGDPEGARDMLVGAKSALDRAPELSIDEMWAVVYIDGQLATLAYEDGDIDRARALILASIQRIREVDLGVATLPRGLAALASWAEERGEIDAARALWSELAASEFEPYETRVSPLRALAAARARLLEGDVDGARSIILPELEQARARDDASAEAAFRVELALLMLRGGDLGQAELEGLAAAPAAAAAMDASGAVTAWATVAEARFSRGDMQGVAAALEEVARAGAPPAGARACIDLAVLWAHARAEHDPAAAFGALAAATGAARRIGCRSLVDHDTTALLADSLRARAGAAAEEIWSSNSNLPIRAVLRSILRPAGSRSVT